jgi:sugar (pentulose or hexulose) kinase
MPSDTPCFAVLDFGTGGGKCVIFDTNGKRRAAVRQTWSFKAIPSEYEHLTPGYAFDPHIVWTTLAQCARAALDQAREASGLVPEEIAGVTSTSLRLGTVLLDHRGREIYCGPNMDGRGFGGALELLEKISREELVRTTGHWPPFLSTAARLLAYQKTATAQKPRYALSLNDWLGYRLSGTVASEPSNSGETYFLDIAERCWSKAILKALEIDESLLPPLVESGTEIGRITPDAAASTGFAAGTPVFVGGADTQCALLGGGVQDSGHAGAVLGTTAPVMAVCDRPDIDESGRLWAGCHVLSDRWTLESNSGETGTGWDWILELLGLDGPSRYADAEALIDAAPDDAGATISFAHPQIFDLETYNPQRLVGFGFRQNGFPGTKGPSRGQVLRAALRNVAFAVRANLEQVEKRLGAEVASLTLTGGMTRSTALREQISHAINRPLFVATEPDATALGAAVLASIGAGTHADRDQAVSAMVRSEEIQPNAELRPAVSAAYEKWREVYSVALKTSI